MNNLSEIPSTPIRFAVYISRSYRSWALCAITAVLIATSLESALHYVIKLLIDSVSSLAESGTLQGSELWKWVIIYPTVSLFCSLIWRTSGFCGQRWLTGIEASTYSELFQYLTGHSSSFFQSRFAGALSNNISNAATGLQSLLATFLWQFLSLGISFITNSVVAFLAHPMIAGIFLLWLLIFLFINYFLIRVLSKLSYHTASTSSELRGKIVDTSTNIASVQQGGHRSFEHIFVGRYIDKYRKAHLKEWFASEWVLLLNNFLLTAFILSMLGASLYLYSLGKISIGGVVMVITLLGSMYMSLLFISMHTIQAIGHYNKVKEGLHELLVPHEISDSHHPADIKISGGDVRFEKVNFAYSENNIFTDLSLHIPAGQKVGLVGASGAGKSTFVNILLRQYEIQAGRVVIDGHDIRNVTLESLRKSIAVVPQDISLFHRKIIENIRYGRLDATDEEVEEAARAALADQFIDELNEKYQTYVGERGVRLSGGQRQRIAVARAFLKNSPILILDEATSALDSESEHAVQVALSRLFKGRTVIAIAHRLSTLREMDRILVLEQGKIVEDGTHAELLDKGGIYSRMWQSQVKGFI